MKPGKDVGLKQGAFRMALIFLVLLIFIAWIIINGFITEEIYFGFKHGGSENVYANLISEPERFYQAVIYYCMLASGLLYGFIWSIMFYRKQCKNKMPNKAIKKDV
ncbi:MAG TPA: hypothetical protein ENJ44_06075 [Oceanospirillales bacterium]|nr:hypothetical protein [Oceanospirillales bacterium]